MTVDDFLFHYHYFEVQDGVSVKAITSLSKMFESNLISILCFPGDLIFKTHHLITKLFSEINNSLTVWYVVNYF